MRVLLIDNFDSFTFNLADDLRGLGAEVIVWRNDADVARLLGLLDELEPPKLVLLSPGPGRPDEAGCCLELVRSLADSGDVPVFGVCLGLQVMVEAFGGEVGSAGEVVHGKRGLVEHDGRGLYSGLPQPLTVGRYHSLVATRVPETLEVTARCGDLVMGVRHRDVPAEGVQFHPESILTPQGRLLLENTMNWAENCFVHSVHSVHPVHPVHPAPQARTALEVI